MWTTKGVQPSRQSKHQTSADDWKELKEATADLERTLLVAIIGKRLDVQIKLSVITFLMNALFCITSIIMFVLHK